MQKSITTLFLLLCGVALPGQDPLDLPNPRTSSPTRVSSPRVETQPRQGQPPAEARASTAAGSSKSQAGVADGRQGSKPDGQGARRPSSSPGSLGAPMGGPLVEDRGPIQSRTMSEGIRERLRADERKPSESQTRQRHTKGPVQDHMEQGGAQPDLLDRVLDRLGGMKAYLAMDAIAVQRNLKANDVKGKLLFAHRFWHWARIAGAVPADEIQWNDSFRYGRRGGRVWARSSDVDRPDLEESIRNEVGTWGFLLRFPYNLRNRDQFRILPEEKVVLLGQTFLRLRAMDRRDEGQDRREGPLALGAKKNWVDIYLDPKELLPLFVEFHRAGQTRRVHLDQYKSVIADGPLFPHRKTVLGEDGETPSLEITWEISKQRMWR